MSNLQLNILNCQKCDKYKEMPCGPVLPIGKGKVMLIGECPGENEALIGQPFVGLCGKLLDKMLDQVGVSRNDVIITNLVKCTSRKNNKNVPLTKKTIKVCADWLLQEINENKPELIITLGKQSTEYFLGKVKMEEVVGKKYNYNNIELIPCYHPSFIMVWGKSYMDKTLEVLKNIKEYV